MRQQHGRSVFDIYKSGQLFNYVITVGDETATERCPIFSGMTRRLHWGFPDPSRATGSDGEKMEQVRAVRDAIRMQIETWAPTVYKES